MNVIKILEVLLIVAGNLGLVYSFSYTKGAHATRLGSVELSIKDTETVDTLYLNC